MLRNVTMVHSMRLVFVPIMGDGWVAFSHPNFLLMVLTKDFKNNDVVTTVLDVIVTIGTDLVLN